MDISRLDLDALMTEAYEKDLDVYQFICLQLHGRIDCFSMKECN